MNSFCGRKLVRNIFVKRRLIFLLAMLLIGPFPVMAAVKDEKSTVPEKKWSTELQLKRYFRSHTSYEFGNPLPPFQAPLSRLEFPMNTWWAGGEARRSFSRFSAGVEVLASIPMESDSLMKDSDWDDESRPDVKTIYSESQCRMEPSYMARGDVDLKVGDWLGMPVWFDLRPVAGVRWQQFTLVAHDGSQTELGNPSESLPGDSIRFKQTYWQYFAGIRAAYDLDRHLKVLRLKLQGQLDWAYVDGYNSDHHLLRTGNRMTYERTKGDAWHASLGLKAGLTDHINAGVEFEYLRIRTEGSHQLVNDTFGIDFSFDHGVKVWSDQFNLMMRLEYMF